MGVLIVIVIITNRWFKRLSFAYVTFQCTEICPPFLRYYLACSYTLIIHLNSSFWDMSRPSLPDA